MKETLREKEPQKRYLPFCDVCKSALGSNNINGYENEKVAEILAISHMQVTEHPVMVVETINPQETRFFLRHKESFEK